MFKLFPMLTGIELHGFKVCFLLLCIYWYFGSMNIICIYHEYSAFRSQKRIPRTGVTDYCDLLCWCWGLNPAPEEPSVLLTADSSLQCPWISLFKITYYIQLGRVSAVAVPRRVWQRILSWKPTYTTQPRPLVSKRKRKEKNKGKAVFSSVFQFQTSYIASIHI